ncbi:hypothetical protein [Hydrogenophaga sp. OTU3427]|uniref:hypothetical protein n=1 Tax=Hydrogenophaga sp. OTU3427 TaxID=3043856 RepID=UPI00406C6353
MSRAGRHLLGWVCWLLCVWGLWGCATTPAPRGEVRAAPATPAELGQSDVNRMATLGMRANLDSLVSLADKLYRRNPREWRKGGAASREEALERLRVAVDQRQLWPSLLGRRDVAALALALSPEFTGDRVAAFIAASADMLIAAHGGKTEFFLIDSLDAQSLYNAARNIEIAVWMLGQRRDAAGQPLLLADEIGPQGRNLSFEREFGKVVGRLDLLAVVTAEKYRRAVVSYVQNLLGGSLLQFLPVKAVAQ